MFVEIKDKIGKARQGHEKLTKNRYRFERKKTNDGRLNIGI